MTIRKLVNASDAKITRLTKAQIAELAACHCELCGISPEDPDWERELRGSVLYVRDLIKEWKRRERRKVICDENA